MCIVVFATMLIAISSVWAPVQASPESFVQSLSRQILAAARTNNTGRFRSLLRSHADVRGIADFALGRFKAKLPASQRSKYYRLAENDMVKFFRDYSSSLRGSGVTVKRVRKNGSFITVDTTINGTGNAVTWKLIQRGGYKVRDVQVIGIWLGGLMRTSYGSILRRSGYKALFAYMQK